MLILISQAQPTTYKPSPLSSGSPQRSSPFQRPHSPASTPFGTTSTSLASSSDHPRRTATQSKPYGNSDSSDFLTSFSTSTLTTTPYSSQRQPEEGNSAVKASSISDHKAYGDMESNAMLRLLPSQAQTLRDAFQVMDRDSDGQISREDVADMLTQLGTYSSCIVQLEI
jgi:hypothetical protein